jgi:hypothetical protein
LQLHTRGEPGPARIPAQRFNNPGSSVQRDPTGSNRDGLLDADQHFGHHPVSSQILAPKSVPRSTWLLLGADRDNFMDTLVDTTLA